MRARALPPPRRIALAVTALLLAAGSVHAYLLITSSQGHVVKWSNAKATTYTHAASMGAATSAGQAYRTAAVSWNAAGSAFSWTVNDGSHAAFGTLPSFDGFNDAQYIDLSLGSGVLGVTYYDWDDATGFLRDTDIDFTTTESFDFQSVALHEQGHALGLDHSSDSAAVMYAWYSGVRRKLALDDLAGVRALYPLQGGGGGGGGGGSEPPPPPTLPPSLPVVSGTLHSIALSGEEFRAGDTVTFSATLDAPAGAPFLAQALYTTPYAFAPFSEVWVPAGGSTVIERAMIVSELPGAYLPAAQALGSDGTSNYRALGTGTGAVRVERDPVPLPVGDRLIASLGPSGGDRVDLFVPKGARFLLEARADDPTSAASMTVLDDRARTKKWRPGKALRAPRTGTWFVHLDNANATVSRYRLFTGPAGGFRAAPGKGAVAADATAEVAVSLPARSGGTLAVKGSRGLDARITGLRSPSGKSVAVTPGAEVHVAEFGEDGTWIVLVEGAAGASGRVKVLFRGDWVEGEERTL